MNSEEGERKAVTKTEKMGWVTADDSSGQTGQTEIVTELESSDCQALEYLIRTDHLNWIRNLF